MTNFEARLTHLLQASVADVRARPEDWVELKARLQRHSETIDFEHRLRSLLAESVADVRADASDWRVIQARMSRSPGPKRHVRTTALVVAGMVALSLPAAAGLKLTSDPPASEEIAERTVEPATFEKPRGASVEEDSRAPTNSVAATNSTVDSDISIGAARGSNTDVGKNEACDTSSEAPADSESEGEDAPDTTSETAAPGADKGCGENSANSDSVSQEGNAGSGDAAAGQTVGVAASPTPR